MKVAIIKESGSLLAVCSTMKVAEDSLKFSYHKRPQDLIETFRGFEKIEFQVAEPIVKTFIIYTTDVIETIEHL